MSLFTINSKMKRSANNKYAKIVNFTLPAFRTKDNIVTCPQAGICAAGCYARSGAYLFNNVYSKHRANLDITFRSNFIELATAELECTKPDLVRIHDSGDFYSEKYLLDWYAIIRLTELKFYTYTKMISLFNELSWARPDNLTVIYSLGGKQDDLINLEQNRHSKVFESKSDLITAGYADASYDDTIALGINSKIGLVYHGSKNYTNTAWNRLKE